MNKKIIALIIIIPVVLMVTIFSVVKGTSLIRDIPVSGIEITNVGEDGFIVRYIDEPGNDLYIQARVLPINAKNQGIKYSVDQVETIHLNSSSNGDGIAEIDGQTGKIKIHKVGRVKLVVESNDGGYKKTCILDIRQKYIPAENFSLEYVSDVNQTPISLGSNSSIDLDDYEIYVNDNFQLKSIVTPLGAHYKYVNWQSSDDKIISFVSSTSGVATFKAHASGEVILTGTLDLHNVAYQPIIKRVRVIVLGDKATPDKVITNIILMGNEKKIYFIGEEFQRNLYMKISFKRGIDVIEETVSVIPALLTGFETAAPGNAIYTINYQGHTIDFEYQVKALDIEEILFPTIKVQLDESIDLNQNIIIKYVNGAHVIKTIQQLFDEIGLTDVPSTKEAKLYQRIITYRGFVTEFAYEVTEDEVGSNTVINILIEGLKEEYIEGETLDINQIFIQVFYDNQTSKIFQINDSQIEIIKPMPSTEISGEYEFIIKHVNYVFNKTIKVSPRGIQTLDIIGSREVYLFGESVNLSDISLVIFYDNGTVKEIPLTTSLVESGQIKTDIVGDALLYTISVYDAKNDIYQTLDVNYKVIDALVAIDDIKTLSTKTEFTLTVKKGTLEAYGLNAYQFDYVNHTNIKTITVDKNIFGNFEVMIELNEGVEAFILEYRLIVTGYQFDSSTYKMLKIEFIDLDNLEIDINVPETIWVNHTDNISVIFKDAKDKENITSLTWYVSDPNCLEIYYQNNLYMIKSLKEGNVTVTVVIKAGTNERQLTKTIEILQPYEGLAFVDMTKTFGLAKEYVIGSQNIHNNEFILALNTFRMRTVENLIINPLRINWSVLNEDGTASTLASFNEFGVLTIHGEGIVILKAIDQLYIDADIVNETNTAYLKVRVINGVNVRTYEDLKIVTENTATNKTVDYRKIVIQCNIEIGPKLINVIPVLDNKGQPTGTYQRTFIHSDSETGRLAGSSFKEMGTTADWTYYKNVGKSHPKIKYLVEFKSDVFGNGYVLDAYNITTIVDKTGNLIDNSVFRGPLDLVRASTSGSIASVKAQDNIVFLVRDNITINNITLQGSDDAFMVESDNNNSYLQLTKLNYVGTTVEVIGDNVRILNSRIKNGRTALRIYGSEIKDQVINVSVESSILSNAREFVLKIGTNQFELGNITNPSPKLMNFEPNDNSYLNNSRFVERFVKTKVSVKNCVLETAGFFTIGMESKFSGSALAGGYPHIEGWNNLAGTSHVAILSLEGDVRLYDWKDVNHVDASTLIEGYQMSFNITDVLKEAAKENIGLITERNNKIYVHGGIAFYGGGKNYHALKLDKFNSDYQFANYSIIINNYVAGPMKTALDLAAGSEPFRFYIYNNQKGISYDQCLEHVTNSSKYNWIPVAK